MPTVLVVDDSRVDRSIVERLLERQADLDWVVEYAENGLEALSKMQDLLPDVVVTDLQMPEMDGLELVAAITATYPRVPVILMTGQGSEAIALEALDRGAASYIPKSRLAEKLLSTVQQVVSTSHAERGHQRISRCIRQARIELHLENDPGLIGPLSHYFQDLLEEMEFGDDADRVHVAIALEEVVVNAMLHGNLEVPAAEVRRARSQLSPDEFQAFGRQRREQTEYRDRRVSVTATVTPTEVTFQVADQGPGIDDRMIPDRGDPESLEAFDGRGFVLMKNFMDQVTYDRQRREVTLVKRPHAAVKRPAAAAR